MSTFREAMDALIDQGWGHEMRAIREVVSAYCVTEAHPEDWLPESVIDWVLEETQ